MLVAGSIHLAAGQGMAGRQGMAQRLPLFLLPLARELNNHSDTPANFRYIGKRRELLPPRDRELLGAQQLPAIAAGHRSCWQCH